MWVIRWKKLSSGTCDYRASAEMKVKLQKMVGSPVMLPALETAGRAGGGRDECEDLE